MNIVLIIFVVNVLTLVCVELTYKKFLGKI